ncbi:hypothetical protein [Chishuiella sp.]|uniref:hypothetical protein n=1 Tax=Chishuiella sp. TaxID=1969467 RepID=UPI0028AF1850|nr:hypothetical protein [Chishuiella sp.]
MTKEIRLSRKEIQSRLNSMRIQPNGIAPRKYGVSIKYFKREEKIPYKRIDYDLSLDLSVNYNQGELVIHKSNFRYNQHEPEAINEIIANTITQSIYPIKVELNEKGQTLNKILNYNNILERWKIEKEKLSEKYQSETLSDFYNAAEEKINNQTILEDSMKYDWFWNLFFHPKLFNYGLYRTRKLEFHLAIIPYKNPICFTGIQKIEKVPTNYYSCIINFESTEQEAPEYFLPKNHPEENTLYMQLHVKYDLDIFHHFAMHTIAKLQFYTKDFHGNKTIISRIEYTQFQQNTENYKTKKLSIDSPFITNGLVKIPQDKWGFYNNESLHNDW